jgi:hypothetical protein
MWQQKLLKAKTDCPWKEHLYLPKKKKKATPIINFLFSKMTTSIFHIILGHQLRVYLGLHLRGLKMLLTLKKNSFEEKKYLFGKKIKRVFKDLKSLKMAKKHF